MREKKDINIEIGGNFKNGKRTGGLCAGTRLRNAWHAPNHLSAIERGASGISLEAFSVFAGLLRHGCKPDYLWGR